MEGSQVLPSITTTVLRTDTKRVVLLSTFFVSPPLSPEVFGVFSETLIRRRREPSHGKGATSPRARSPRERGIYVDTARRRGPSTDRVQMVSGTYLNFPRQCTDGEKGSDLSTSGNWREVPGLKGREISRDSERRRRT